MHDPGGKSLFKLQLNVTGDAYITPDGVHRLWLKRAWRSVPKYYVAIVGLNPSTAQPDLDDPTIRRDIGFAQGFGYDALFKINPISYRCTDPSKLPLEDLVHPENTNVIRAVAAQCSQVILAYGAAPRRLQPFIDEMLKVLRLAHPRLYCLGRTAAGHPRHTLYLRKDTPLEEF